MLQQVLRNLWRFQALGQCVQVVVAGEQQALGGADALGHQGAVGQFSDPHRHIDAFFDQVNEAIVEPQVHFDLGVCSEKTCHQGHQFESAVAHRSGHAQPATQLLFAL